MKNLTDEQIAELEALLAKATPGEWDAEHKGSNVPEECGCVVTDEHGNELFDTFNRGYKVSLVEHPDDQWLDAAGMRDLAAVAALHNNASVLLSMAKRANAMLRALEPFREAKGFHDAGAMIGSMIQCSPGVVEAIWEAMGLKDQ